MPDDYEIRIVDSWPADEIVELYRAGGWWMDHYSPAGIPDLIKGSFAFAVALEKATGRAVGMGRAISDGASDAWLQDIVVLKDHRRRGIGREIAGKLLQHCLDRGLAWVGLVAEPGSGRFYGSLGFETLPGEPMVFRRKPGV